MRINKYIAQATGLSRRAADAAIADGKVRVNNAVPDSGQQIQPQDVVVLDGERLIVTPSTTTICLHKPVGYICSRDGQGNKTIYELLPPELHHLKPVGRLDKQSSGLLLMTDDGQLAYELTHPKFEKYKKYKIALNKSLTDEDFSHITQTGVTLDDGPSKLDLIMINSQPREWKVTMHEGRNRQIRRTFEALGYNVVKLHRTHFGTYELGTISSGNYITSTNNQTE